jgi:hypothetical protein
MSTQLPKRSIDEFETEALLARVRIGIVEGPTDVSAYAETSDYLGLEIHWVSVGEVLTPEGGFALDFDPTTGHIELGNRERVIQLAESYVGNSLFFIVDLDTQPSDVCTSSPALHYTDVPGLEAYFLTELNVDWLIRYAGLIPAGEQQAESRDAARRVLRDDITLCLLRILYPLYFIRREQRSARSEKAIPDSLSKYTSPCQSGGIELDVPKMCRQVGVVPDAIPATPGDFDMALIRRNAYGHDVAKALLVCVPELRTRCDIRTPAALERLMLAQTVPVSLSQEQLFISLADF